MKITAHALIRNEEKFIWFAVNSVLDHVDEMMIWDMESGDNTEKKVKETASPKIKYTKVPFKGTKELAAYRQKMLDGSDADWIFILDGDEVWWDKSIETLTGKVRKAGKTRDLAVVPNYMLVGDIYHYQEEKAGRYKIGSVSGHYNVRALRKTEGLKVEGLYPNEAYVTGNGIKIQDLPDEKMLFLKEGYLHASFLKRSGKDRKKIKYEIGREFPLDFYYPEVFFRERPESVSCPFEPMGGKYKLIAGLLTPFKKIRRRII